MQKNGTLVQMDRYDFEQGNWAELVLQAWEQAGGDQQERGPLNTDVDPGTVIVDELEQWLGAI